MEKLIVNDFVTLKNIELNLNKINILIGPQSSGKSLIAKLLTFIKDIPSFTIDYIGDEDNSSYAGLLESRFKRIFPSYAWEKNIFSILYTNKKFHIHISNQGSKVIFNFGNNNFYKLVDHGKNYFHKNISTDKNYVDKYIHRRNFATQYSRDELGLPSTTPCYIPAGRSFFSSFKNPIKLSANDINVDYFISRFGSDYEDTKAFMNIGLFNEQVPPRIKLLIKKLLNGRIERQENEEWIVSDTNRIKSCHASSGQQESIPMITLLTTWPFSSISRYSDFVIEEPEAHLFPTSQNRIVSIISMIHNQNKSIGYTITTHSPYIISSINNLLLASNIATNHPKKSDAVKDIIDESEFIKFDHISAYQITDMGSVSILDEDNKMINAEYIDQISNEISSQFDSLLDIEFGDSE